MRGASSGRNARSLLKFETKRCIMKATTSTFVVLVLAVFTVLGCSSICQTSHRSVPFTGIGSLRPLRSSSSSSFNMSDPDVGLEPSTNSSSSSGADDAHASATNSSSSSAVDTTGGALTNSSYYSSSSAVYAIETIFTNTSAGAGDSESHNSTVSTNVSAVEEELIETLEVDQQVTGKGSTCSRGYLTNAAHYFVAE